MFSSVAINVPRNLITYQRNSVLKKIKLLTNKQTICHIRQWINTWYGDQSCLYTSPCMMLWWNHTLWISGWHCYLSLSVCRTLVTYLVPASVGMIHHGFCKLWISYKCHCSWYVKMDSAGMLDIVDRSTWNQMILNSFKWYEHNVYFEKYSVNLNNIC